MFCFVPVNVCAGSLDINNFNYLAKSFGLISVLTKGLSLKEGTGNRGTGNGERGTRNGERGTGNGEWGISKIGNL